MKNKWLFPILLITFVLLSPAFLVAQSTSCNQLTKYYIWQRIAIGIEFGDEPGLDFFEEFLAQDSYLNFVCELDSLVINSTPIAEETYKVEFSRNSRGDVTSMMESDISDGKSTPERKIAFNWDYAAGMVTIILEDYNNGSWEILQKADIRFNAQGLMRQFVLYSWDNNNWKFRSDATYEYDKYGNLTHNLTRWFGVFFSPYETIKYTYNNLGKVQTATLFYDDKPDEPYRKVEYEYLNNNKVKATNVDWEDKTKTWCDELSIVYSFENGFPTKGQLFMDTSYNCNPLVEIGTFYAYKWDSKSGRLLQLDVANNVHDNNGDGEEYGARCRFFYKGISTSVEAITKPSIDFQITNPLVSNQPFSITGLPTNGIYQYTWIAITGKVLQTAILNNYLSAIVPNLVSGVYILKIQNIQTGAFGVRKIIIR